MRDGGLPRSSRWPPAALFAVLSSAYFAVGTVLMLRYNIFEGDGISRVANAGFTLSSRDPHLSAIGFVWNPLPSLVQIAVLPLARWWPELQTQGLAGVIQSAMFMAGAAVMIRQIAIDRGTSAPWRWVAIGCFALNPVIVMYGSLGMSEAAEVFCILWCVRYLIRWVGSRRVGDLAWAGMALGIGYLTRYEMVPATAGAAALVATLVAIRSPLPLRMRAHQTVLCALIVSFPTIGAIVVWAATGWIVSGELFATLTSQYGNTSQVMVALERGGISHDSGWLVIAERLFAMQPFVGIAIILAAALGALRVRVEAAVPVAVLGAVLIFAAWGQYSATTFGWFRFYILAVPLVVVVALVCWRPGAAAVGRWHPLSFPSALGAGLLTVSMVVGIPVTTRSLLDEDITSGNQVILGVASLFDPQRYPPEERWYRRMGDDDRMLAKYLDGQNLPDGSVLADTFQIKLLWLASTHPRQFVITSDYDFTAALNRPWDHGVRYIVVTNPAGNAALDAINKRYPTLWADGAGIGTLSHSADGPFREERWRIYRVDEPPENHYRPFTP
ncbi:MAG: glycosyltransferase family 39 protein [Mycobacterium sp.]